MKFALRPLLAIALVSSLRADFDPARWQFRRSLNLAAPQPMARLKPDGALYQGTAAGLSDLRIMRDRAEVPYVLEVLRGEDENRELRATVLNQAVVPGKGLELTLDAGSSAKHDRVRISTPLRDYKQRVRIETSDDQKNWAIALDNGYIFAFTQSDRTTSETELAYPVSTRRYVRLTIFGWSDPKAVSAAFLLFHQTQPTVRDPIAAVEQPPQVQNKKDQSTDITVDLTYQGQPHDLVFFQVSEPARFSRSVEIENSRDGKVWTGAGQGTISRTPQGESLSFVISEVDGRYLRARIWNHDNPPIVVRRIEVSGIVRTFRFPATGAGPYWLYYGNAAARQPSYDPAAILPLDPSTPDANATLGPQEANPGYHAPVPPLSDRNPAVLYAVLIAAVLGMGFLTVRFLLKVQTSRAGSGPPQP